MTCLSELIFHLATLVAIVGYPTFQALKSVKDNEPNKLWISYFFILGLITLGEYTVLIPVTLLLNSISTCLWPSILSLICVWLSHPTYRGALFIDQLASAHITKHFPLLSNTVGNVLSFVGIPTRTEVKSEDQKKN